MNHPIFLWYEEEYEVPNFKSVPSSYIGPPSNSGLQGPPFQPLNITYDPPTFAFDQPYKQTESKKQVTGKQAISSK